MKTGGCLCGAVRYWIEGVLRPVIYCHCGQCRRQSGQLVAATRCEDTALTIAGADSLTWYAASPEARRGFCRTCGSLMFWKANGSQGTSIMAGSLDLPTGVAADRHIFTAQRGDYYTIDDGLPQFEERQ